MYSLKLFVVDPVEMLHRNERVELETCKRVRVKTSGDAANDRKRTDGECLDTPPAQIENLRRSADERNPSERRRRNVSQCERRINAVARATDRFEAGGAKRKCAECVPGLRRLARKRRAVRECDDQPGTPISAT